ncbi:MAG: uroporphyrinogen decarboxylase family protein [bacterium]
MSTTMTMTKEERVLRVINRKDVDYLPSQITFSDRMRDKPLSEALGLAGAHELDAYLENHLYLALSRHDKVLFYRNDRAEMDRLQAMGYCGPDWKNKIVYDAWGMGVMVGTDGFFACFHPLQKQAGPEVAGFMVPGFNREVLGQEIEDAVANYTVPSSSQPGLYDDLAADLMKHSGDFLVIPCGYFGIFERAWGLMGFPEFMINLAVNPKAVHDFLDKITEYRLEYAKQVVKMGFKVAHHGDDLGTQNGTLISKQMFREFILPRFKRAWQPYNDAGIPIILHSCGNLIGFLPDLIDIGLRVLEPVQSCMDLKLLKREFGKDLTFWGGIETQKLPFLAPEQVRQMTRDTIRVLGKGGGYIIGPSQEVMNDVPLTNVIALVETIVEERKRVLEL